MRVAQAIGPRSETDDRCGATRSNPGKVVRERQLRRSIRVVARLSRDMQKVSDTSEARPHVDLCPASGSSHELFIPSTACRVSKSVLNSPPAIKYVLTDIF